MRAGGVAQDAGGWKWDSGVEALLRLINPGSSSAVQIRQAAVEFHLRPPEGPGSAWCQEGLSGGSSTNGKAMKQQHGRKQMCAVLDVRGGIYSETQFDIWGGCEGWSESDQEGVN